MIDIKNVSLFDSFLQRLMKHEGFEPKVYTDSTGYLTIGYGTNLEEGISKEQAQAMLEIHIKAIVKEVMAIPYADRLDEARFYVILDMAYNMGVPRLRKFKKMWEAIGEKDWENASYEMLDSLWARQVGNRATELSQVMKSGMW